MMSIQRRMISISVYFVFLKDISKYFTTTMNQEDSFILTKNFVNGTPVSDEPHWINILRSTNPHLTALDLLKIREAFKNAGLSVCTRPSYCKCDDFQPGKAPGYKGNPEQACLNCVQRCWRCKNPSIECGYSNTSPNMKNVCYGCACGDNEENEDYSMWSTVSTMQPALSLTSGSY